MNAPAPSRRPDTPRVTVLMTVYNGADHLADAVASILDQSLRDLELLIVDDGSTDGTADLLGALDDPRVRVITQRNQGLVAALNRGLAEAGSDLVARMDADDISHPRRLELQVGFLDEHPGVAAVGCCYDVVDEHGARVDVVHVAAESAYLRRRLYFRNNFAHASMTFRRSAVRDVGDYREVGPAEDYDLWTRLAARYDLGCLAETLFTYHRGNTGISARQRSGQLTALATIRAALHRARPLSVPSAGQLLREARRHQVRYAATCSSALATFVFDHAWLTLILARQGRPRAAARLAVGVIAVVALHPSSVTGFPLPGLRKVTHRLRNALAGRK